MSRSGNVNFLNSCRL